MRPIISVDNGIHPILICSPSPATRRAEVGTQTMATALSTTKFDYAGFTDAEATSLRAAAAEIREAGHKFVGSYFDMGRPLLTARKQFDQWGRRQDGGENGQWKEWLEKETSLSYQWASQIMASTKKFGVGPGIDQAVSLSVLRQITQENTPDAVVDHVLAHPEMSKREAEQFRKGIIAQTTTAEIKERPLPTASEARKQARASGTPIVSSDGKIYFGATEKESEDSQRRRSQTYRVRDGVELVANIGITPETWVKEAWEWQIHDFNLADIDTAIKWLSGLLTALKTQRKIVDAKQES